MDKLGLPLQLGFKGMVEAACGADAVTVHEANEFVERMEEGQGYMTNSCCPGFINFIEVMFPDQKDKISSTVSPMIATGRLIKKAKPEAVVVFVGPCIAKKTEITNPSKGCYRLCYDFGGNGFHSMPII